MLTTDMSDIWNKIDQTNILGTIAVRIPQVGAFVAYQGKTYVILSTQTFQEDTGEEVVMLPKCTITTLCTILEITDECEDAGNPAITVNSVELRVI